MSDHPSSRDRRLDELAGIEFTGSLSEAFGYYAAALRMISNRWSTELELASTDARAALTSIRGTNAGAAKRIARRLRRAQTLVATLAGRAEQFPKEYARQFLSSPEVAKGMTRHADGRDSS